MKKMKLKGVFLVVGLTMLFAMTPIAHAGEGGPPGDSEYAPPPYSGQLTLTFVEQTYLYVCGRLDQMGQSGQSIDFGENYPACWVVYYTEFFPGEVKPFAELTSRDLHGIVFVYDTPEEDYELQILGVGQLYWNEQRDGFVAKFVMMKLVQK
jgi:hypothetical protein